MDLIDRQSAINAINTWDKFGADERGRIVRWHEGLVIYVHLRDVLTSIVNLPSAQPEIIHCRDCKWHNGEINQCNAQVCASMYGEDFCSKGERREE